MLREKEMKKLFSTLLIVLLIPLYCYAEDTPQSILSSSQEKISLIAIDPGLGGKEVGPSGCDDRAIAKDINLQVARNVAERIKNDLGIDVILTRENDVYVPIEERSAIANMKGADLLISIQTNGASDQSASGIETYFLKLSYEQDSITKAVHESSTSAKQSKDLGTVLSDLIQSAKSAASERLADNVQKNVCQQLEKENKTVKNRGAKQAPFDVLLGAQMPAISLYIGFLTNAEECNYLSSKEYQDNISIGVVKGIQSFIEQMSTQQTLKLGAQTVAPGTRR
jgi:N-acetylmuramoyl-L-alanine amidase